MAEAAGSALPGTACARSIPAASKSAAIPTVWRTSFMALFLFLHRHGRRGGQTLFGNDFHGLLDGNMYDAAGSIDPLQFFIGLGIGSDLFAQIGLWIGFLARKTKTLEPRLRRQFPLMSLARWWRRRIGRNRISGRKAQNKNTRRIKISQMAILGSTLALRFTSCERSRKKGTKKWNTSTITATTPQPLYSRVR